MDNAEPTRYRVAPIEHQMTYGGGVLESTPDGPLVAYGDYARLKAECQARQAENSVLAVECDSLKAEADQMATILSDLLQSDLIACSVSRGVIKSTLAKWNAAPK